MLELATTLIDTIDNWHLLTVTLLPMVDGEEFDVKSTNAWSTYTFETKTIQTFNTATVSYINGRPLEESWWAHNGIFQLCLGKTLTEIQDIPSPQNKFTCGS